MEVKYSKKTKLREDEHFEVRSRRIRARDRDDCHSLTVRMEQMRDKKNYNELQKREKANFSTVKIGRLESEKYCSHNRCHSGLQAS